MADEVPGHVASSVAVRARGIDGAKPTVALPSIEDSLELELSLARGDPGGVQPAF